MITLPSSLTVPFFLDEHYLDFLTSCVDELDSLHIYLPNIYSGIYRKKGQCAAIPLLLLQGLERLPGPQKYILLPQRARDLKVFQDQKSIRSIIFLLEQCYERGQLQGIVCGDHYLLQCLADYAPPALVSQLEAIPSANYMLDSMKKIETQLTYIAATGFKLPSRIALDCSLNRDMDKLADLCLSLHQRYPALKIEVLANEGCLFRCPYKLSCDDCLAILDEESQQSRGQLSRRLGCSRFLHEQPHKVLQSPFIRPEDVDLYLYHADTIRICWRTLGTQGLMPIIQAYRQRRYKGNILSLLDSTSWMAERFYIENSLLSFNFTSILSQCDNRCHQCGFCKEVFDSIASPLFPYLEEKGLEN